MRPLRRSIVGPLAALLSTSWATACRESGEPAKVPSSIASATSALPVAEVGSVLAAAPSFLVRDASDEAIGGVTVSVAVGEGGGTLRNPPTRSASGPTSVGQWTLGTRAGRNSLLVTVGQLSAFLLEASGIPGAPSAVRVASGDD
ncbi:MAG: hypothetical protein ABI910_03395 [Gemmatimonadota bacterium]